MWQRTGGVDETKSDTERIKGWVFRLGRTEIGGVGVGTPAVINRPKDGTMV